MFVFGGTVKIACGGRFIEVGWRCVVRYQFHASVVAMVKWLVSFFIFCKSQVGRS